MSVLIIDCGMGNLGSVKRAFEECGGDVLISDDPIKLKKATHIVLPGVGAFGDGMANLKNGGWIDPLKNAVLAEKIPFLGICLGMQLLADRGFEGGEFAGLGLISGEVKKLAPVDKNERVPHIGWNEVCPLQSGPLWDGIAAGTDFYFVHSFHFVPKDNKSALAETPYCGRFVCAIAQEKIFGVQFHPEKSSKAGFQVIRNFLNFSGIV